MRDVIFALLVSTFALAPHAHAQSDAPLPDTVSMEDAVRLVRARSERLAEIETRVDSAEADRIGAATRPNPVASYRALILATGTNVNGAVVHDTWVEQPSIRPRLRRMRMEAADAHVDAERANVAAAAAELAYATRGAFVELRTAERRLAAIESAIADLQAVDQLVRARAAAGALSDLDVARIEVERSQWDADLARARIDAELAASNLALLASAPGWHPHAADSADDESPPMLLEGAVDEALEHRPAVIAAQANLHDAEAQLAAERSATHAGPSIIAGGSFTSGPRSASFGAGIAWPLPVFDRNQAAIARARADLEAAEHGLAATRLEVRTEIEANLARRRAAHATLDAFEAGSTERAERLRRMFAAGRAGGSLDAYQILDGLRSLRTLGERDVELRAEAMRADAAFLRSLGR